MIDIIYGKIRTRLGPFSGSNLSISNQAPGFTQIQIRTKSDKTNFIFIIGELYSNLFEVVEYSHGDEEDEVELKKIQRYIVNHRFDYKIKENLRIGFYEQVIVGHNLSLIYLVPTMPFWSAQHSLGDLDNLQIGFDIDYIKNNNRLYFSLLMDEWAPYDTFNSDHHNWFGSQIGFSRVSRNTMLYKIEYSRIEPQVYIHDDPANTTYHYDYPLGYWGGGDSEEIIFLIFSQLKNNKDFKFTFRHTNIGTPEYSVDADFLEGPNLKRRTLYEFQLNKIVDTKLGPIKYCLKIKNVTSKNLYDIDNFIDYQISMLYNINY